MVEVDISRLGNIVQELKSLIDDYDVIQLNIFNQLKDSFTNWQDGNSITFENKIKDEKVSSDVFLVALESNREVFQYVYDEYKKIGNKLHINLDKKNSIMSTIDECLTCLDDILSDLNGVTRSFYYRELNLINNQRDIFTACKSNIQKLKNKIKELYKKVEMIEEKVSSQVARIEMINVNNFDYEFSKG